MSAHDSPHIAGNDDAYRRYVRTTLERALDMLARISFGDFSQRLDLSQAPDNELTELLWGLNLLADDLADAQKQIQTQQLHAQLRRQMWELAAQQFDSEKDFITTLLGLVGPTVDAKRLTYYTITREDGPAQCLAQWCRPGVDSTADVPIPAEFWKAEFAKRYTEYRRGHLDPFAQKYLGAFFERAQVATVAAVVCGTPDKPVGFVTFSDDNEARVWGEEEKLFLLETGRIIVTKLEQMRAEAALREANARLEAEVARRTEQLAAANRELSEDINRRIKAEQALREREELYRSLVEASPDAIMVCAPGGGILMTNEAAVRLFGVSSRDQLLGRNYPDFAAPDERDRILTLWPQHHEGRSLRSVECRLMRSDGTSFLAECRFIEVGRGDMTPRNMLCIVRDITAQRRQEEDALRAQKLESLGLLAGGIAHDFNNVLAGISGSLALARHELSELPVPSRERIEQILTDAEEAALRATSLTKQLLTFARGGTPVKAPALIHEIIERALRLCLAGSNVRSRLEVAPDTLPVDVDAGQIEQALSNILINAVQAMPNGGEVVVAVSNETVTTSDPHLSPGTYVRISITDSGPGIPPENRLKVFDPYFTTKKDGLGLGLTTAYSVVRRHGGMLTCESRNGQGATFVMLLPASSPIPAPQHTTPPSVSRPKPSGCRVLVMDDDPTVRTVIERLLRAAGYSTVAVGTGADACRAYADALATDARFDAVIMDLTVRGGPGGKEVVRQLQALDPTVRAIVVSGYSSDPVLSNYQSYGFRGGLAKPFRASQLLEVVARVITET